ncbi:hypothetical protein FrEUN1fDRAFT_0394 [Parafrankia sp. EUN1f]|nr:hypothetical protein FrEUN1fDRAFT_0394 [Parafrankia sp. EUN1f]
MTSPEMVSFVEMIAPAEWDLRGIMEREGVRLARAAELAMMRDGHTTAPEVHRDGCYICEDPEFAQMGMPLCKPCPRCVSKGEAGGGHVPADDTVCTDCGTDIEFE